MDSFSLLKYWRASTGTTLVAITTAGRELLLPSSTHATATVANAATTEEEVEDGSFFDLELSSVVTLNEQDESDSTRRLDDFTSVVSLDAAALHRSPPAPGSRLKSATRFRVFALGLNKKLKSDTGATVDSPKSSGSGSGGGGSNNFFVEVFTGSRNNSSKSKEDQDSAEEKRFSKEVVHKYINSKIKPLYVRVCRRYGERFSAPLAPAAGGDPTGKKKKVVMVKSRSAVAAVTMPPPPPPAAVQRRDDSLLQQEDGIQSAIAHCKKSFNASSKVTETLVADAGEERTKRMV